MFSKKIVFLLCLVLISSLVFAGGQSETNDLNVAIRNAAYDTLDPHVSSFTQAAYVFQNVFERLIYLEGNGELVPWLALSWESNDDATEWVLRLRQDVVFHDGSLLDAETVKFNFDRMVNADTQSKMDGPLMGPYNRSQVIDNYTIKVYFDSPYALFSFALSSPFMGMVSSTAVKDYGKEFTKHLVGSGPFKFVEEIPNNKITLEKYEEYNWAPSNFHDGPAYVDKLIFRFVVEEETRLAALETGEVDIIDEVSPARVEGLNSDENFVVVSAPKVGVARTIFFNTKYPPTDSLLVRQAINHAVNREQIKEGVLKELYPLATQVLTPGVRFYDNSMDNYYPYDTKKAIALLEQDGWTEINSDGYRVKDGKVLEIFHATWPGLTAEAPAEIMQAQLKKVGVKFDIHIMSGSAMMDGISSVDSTFNSALVGDYTPDPGLVLNNFFNSKGLGTINFTHFATDHLDSLLRKGLETPDPAKRQKIYSEISLILLENAVGVPLYANASIFGMKSKVKGFKFDPYAHPEFFDVQITE